MLTDDEKKRLEELTSAKKSGKLSSKDFKEFKALQAKSKSNLKDKKSLERKNHFDPGNDPSWWMKQSDLVRDSATFKSNYVAGRAIDGVRIPFVVPGILAIELNTCYHPCCEATDAVNVWARDLYLKMFQKYRPANNYSASDLGIALLAAIEPVKLIAVYERIYGIINRYSVLNVNMPDLEARALGLNSTTLNYLQTHLSDFRYDLNYLIRKAQRLCIPKDIALIADAISLLGYEYIDHNNPRGQLILFTLQNYGVYSDTDMSTGGSIAFVNGLANDLFDFGADNMCKALNTVLNALLGSDSIQRIYADLVVWFGAEAMLQFNPVPEDYLVVPAQSESILHKIHNLEVMPTIVDADSYPTGGNYLTSWAHNGLSSTDQNKVLDENYHIYQYNDAIVTVASIKDNTLGTAASCPFNGIGGRVLKGTASVYGLGTAHLIDGYNIEVTPEFIIEGSLFKYVNIPTDDFKATLINSCVNWLVNGMYLFRNNLPNSPLSTPNWRISNSPTFPAAYLALIDWAPLSYNVNVSGYDTVINDILGDLDVIVPISAGDLNRVQRTCFISALTTEVPVLKG